MLAHPIVDPQKQTICIMYELLNWLELPVIYTPPPSYPVPWQENKPGI